MRSLVISAACAIALNAMPGCDGDTEGPTATSATTEDATVAQDSHQPLDTAIPEIGDPNDNRDLLNGSTARIGHIIDGDTFNVYVGQLAPKKYTIRMAGFSAPECNKEHVDGIGGGGFACTSDDELYGLKSYQALKAMLDGKTVRVTCDVPVGAWCKVDNDFFDRYVAYVEIDGKDAAVEMARGGNGFSYTSFASSKRGAICRAEDEAQAAKRGIWALGTLNQIMDDLPDTRGWYYDHHDERCAEAL